MNIRFLTSIIAWFSNLFGTKNNDHGRPFPNYVKRENKFTPSFTGCGATIKGYHKGSYGKAKHKISKPAGFVNPKISDTLKKATKNKRRNLRQKAAGITRKRPFRIRPIKAVA